eukprot:m.27964 g.27964  ORF g.27964 m.27964 type:complete len:368 (+) comp14048_c0_seq1:219-1322(+)
MLALYREGAVATLTQIASGCSLPNQLSQVPHPPKTALVTGANRGIGLEIAQQLYINHGVNVILACVSSKAADDAQIAILQAQAREQKNKHQNQNQNQNLDSSSLSPSPKLYSMTLDLKSFDSIDRFVSQVEERFSRLDLLINNAGVMLVPFQVTPSGFEHHMGVNFVGHVRLIYKLLPLLQQRDRILNPFASSSSSGFARIVNVSSVVHRTCQELDFRLLEQQENLFKDKKQEMEVFYSPHAAYAQSKLALLMISYFLNRQFQSQGMPVSCVAVDPGVVYTGLYQHLSCFPKAIFRVLGPWVLWTPQFSAATVIRAALQRDQDGDGGGDVYYWKGKRVMSSALSYDKQLQKQLWERVCLQINLPAQL